MTISRRQIASAEAVAGRDMPLALTRDTLRAVASALGAQDPDVVLAHLNPRLYSARFAEILVEGMIEAMQDAGVQAA